MTTTETDGLYRVTIARYGRRSTTRSQVYLNFHIYGLPDDPVDMDYFVWVIQNDHRTVVVDTGYSEAGGRNRGRGHDLHPGEIFAELGVTGAPDVVVTHAHYDHAGNLDLFPRSRVIMSGAERDFWAGPMAERTLFAHSKEDEDLAELQRADREGRLVTFRDRLELAPGIELIEVGGHTPGQIVVTAATAEGTVLLASDAVHYYEEYEDDLPFRTVADLPGMYTAFDTIREMERTGRIQHLVSGHDPSTLGRFTPVTTGRLAGVAAVIG